MTLILDHDDNNDNTQQRQRPLLLNTLPNYYLEEDKKTENVRHDRRRSLVDVEVQAKREEEKENSVIQTNRFVSKNDFGTKNCSLLYKQESLLQEPEESETKSSLLSSEDVQKVPEEESTNAKPRRCRELCKNLTFHQCLVFMCVFYNVFVCVGLPFSLGVLYPEFKVTFDSSNAEAATVVSVATGLITCGGIVGGLLVNKIGSRFTILLGSILSFLGTFASFFAVNIWFLVGSLGVLMGLGNAIIYIPCMVVISEQFPDSTMATLIITSARPAGVITLPILMNALLAVYFWRGTLLIMSGLILNICVGGLIATHPTKKSMKMMAAPTKKKKIFDVSILKIPKFLLIMIAHSIINSSVSAVFMLIVDFSIEQGYSRNRAVIILTIQAVFAMLARGVVGVISLLPKRIRPPHTVLFFLSGVFGSVTVIIVPFVIQVYKNYIGTMILWGLFVGIRNAIIPVLCLEIVGKEQYALALGISQTLIGIFTIIAGPIGGMIRDITGTYTVTFVSSGVVGIVASIISALLYVAFFTHFGRFPKEKSTGQV